MTNRVSRVVQVARVAQARCGFTLIELLITIAIIGILSTIGFGSVRTFQQQARDTGRKNDLRQYQIALENYASANNSLYPSRNPAGGILASVTLCADLGSFISGCPEAPGGSGFGDYRYQSDGNGSGGATAREWVMWTRLERSDNYWVACSNGKFGEEAREGFSFSGGDCPLP